MLPAIGDTAMSLSNLVYASRPFGFEQATLNGILMDARAYNPTVAVTGALICRADIYLQLLEGASGVIETLFGRIKKDDRHLNVVRLVSGPITERLFPAWAMRDDPARSWMWTQAEVDGGAIERASPDEIFGIFRRLANEIADGAA